MLTCIPNQPLNLCPPLVSKHCDEPRIPLQMHPDDIITVQLHLQPGPTSTSWLSDVWVASEWNIDPDQVINGITDGGMRFCMGSKGTVGVVQTTAINEPIGTTINLTFTIEEVEGTLTVYIAGHLLTFTDPGEYSINLVTLEADVSITVDPGTGGACLSPIIARKGLDLEVAVRDASDDTEIAGYTIVANSWMFNLNAADDIVTFTLPIGILPPSPECIYLSFGPSAHDPDTEGVLCSQPIRIGEDCPDTIAVRACLDAPALGLDAGVWYVRVPGTLSRPRWEYTIKEQRLDDGTIVRHYADRTSALDLALGVIDGQLHPFLAALPLFDHVYIEDAEYVVDGDYTADYGAMVSTASAQMTVRPKVERVRRVQCGEGGPGCAPSADPICPEPFVQIAGRYEEDGYYIEVVVYSTYGFDVGAIQWWEDSTMVHSTNGPFPGSHMYGPMPLPGAGPVLTVIVTNRQDANCNYQWIAPVPAVCGGASPGYGYMEVVGTGTPEEMEVYTNSGEDWNLVWQQMGTVQTAPNGDPITIDAPLGEYREYCLYATDASTGSFAPDGVYALDVRGGDVGLTLLYASWLEHLVSIDVWGQEAFWHLNASGCVRLLSLHLNGNAVTMLQLPTSHVAGGMSIIEISDNTELVNLDIPVPCFSNGILIDLSGCGLSVPSVNGILANAVASGATGGTLTLGGSNGTPSGQGVTDMDELVNNRGWTVTT